MQRVTSLIPVCCLLSGPKTEFITLLNIAPGVARRMKLNQARLAATGILLLLLGAVLNYVSSRGFQERRYFVDAGPCRLAMNMVTKSGMPDNADADSVVLFHGISANKAIMTYLARAFAAQGLRVFVPDLPGHGRSPGPFSPSQAEGCSLSFVRGLAAHGLITPDRTILAGHSMGGAIALRIAPTIRPAGLIAISPAPMQTAHGVTPEKLLFNTPPPVLPNTLILVGQFEINSFSANAADLATTRTDGTVEFLTVPYNSHVSVLFSSTVAAKCQEWAARVLHLSSVNRLPVRANFVGGLLGLLGIFLIAGPFLRELFGHKLQEEPPARKLPSPRRTALEVAGVSFGIVFLLRFWMPFRSLPLFEGNYLTSFFLLAGLALLLLHPKLTHSQFTVKPRVIFAAAFSGFLLHVLITGWFELTVTGSWLTFQRWTRFPLFFLAAFAFLYALEILLGPVTPASMLQRYGFSLLLIVIAWVTLAAGVLYLQSGQILLVLLSPYFAIFFVLYRLGAQLVRNLSASATAAAIFGAILLTGFCLVLFPVS
jgi:pimeloyl-ACP methyl ester carboxylesterase